MPSWAFGASWAVGACSLRASARSDWILGRRSSTLIFGPERSPPRLMNCAFTVQWIFSEFLIPSACERGHVAAVLVHPSWQAASQHLGFPFESLGPCLTDSVTSALVRAARTS